MYFEPGINSSIEYIICKFKQLRKMIYHAIDFHRCIIYRYSTIHWHQNLVYMYMYNNRSINDNSMIDRLQKLSFKKIKNSQMLCYMYQHNHKRTSM